VRNQEFEIVPEIEYIRPNRSGRSLNHGQMSKKRISRLDNLELVVHDRP